MPSVTDLCSYEYCARKMFLQKVLKVVEIPKEAIVKGNVRHTAFDDINKKEREIILSIEKDMTKDDVIDLYKNTYSKILRNSIIKNRKAIERVGLEGSELFKQAFPHIAHEGMLRSLNVLNSIEKHQVYGEDLWSVLTPKIKSEFRINSKTLDLRGIIDQLEVHKDKLIPIELKTGSMPKDGVWPSHQIQIGAYIMLLQKEFSNSSNEGKVRYLDHDKTISLTLNPFLEEEIKALTQKVNDLLKSKEVPDFCANQNKCQSCGIKDICHNKELIKQKTDEINLSF